MSGARSNTLHLHALLGEPVPRLPCRGCRRRRCPLSAPSRPRPPPPVRAAGGRASASTRAACLARTGIPLSPTRGESSRARPGRPRRARRVARQLREQLRRAGEAALLDERRRRSGALPGAGATPPGRHGRRTRRPRRLEPEHAATWPCPRAPALSNAAEAADVDHPPVRRAPGRRRSRARASIVGKRVQVAGRVGLERDDERVLAAGARALRSKPARKLRPVPGSPSRTSSTERGRGSASTMSPPFRPRSRRRRRSTGCPRGRAPARAASSASRRGRFSPSL